MSANRRNLALGWLLALAAIVLFVVVLIPFVIILLHEFGHVFAARR